jgi:multidrug resistance protein MdtO
MESVLAMTASANPRLETLEETRSASRLFVSDAFSNPEYLRFALAGTAASMLCYVIYVGLNWPGISTAVTTCALTALSDIGSSRQKQILRIGGAAVGGFVFGLGSQILILPYIDSIVGLALLFAFVTGLSAYVATSSPRLSYAGLQMAFAFYLINVLDFTISLDLTVGRDRAIGVLLGIVSMWLVFERLYRRPAAIQMVRMFARSARLIAGLATVSANGARIARIGALRDEIANTFASVNAESDAVIFESGEHRPSYLAARERVRRWLSTLRTLYLLELALLPCSPIEEYSYLSPAVPQSQARLPVSLSEPLIRIAEFLESQVSAQANGPSDYKDKQEARAKKELQRDSSAWIVEEHINPLLSPLSELMRELERDVLREPVFDFENTGSADCLSYSRT